MPSSQTEIFRRVVGRPPDPEEALVTFDSNLDSAAIARQIAVSAAAFAKPATTVRLYEAVFGHKPDAGGYQYWLDALNNGGGVTVRDMALAFSATPEFKQRFDPQQGRSDLIDRLYENVLARAPDEEGRSFWLKSGYALHEMLVYFAESPEFVARAREPITSFFLDIGLEGSDDPTGTDEDDFMGSALDLAIEIAPVVFVDTPKLMGLPLHDHYG